MFLQPKKDQKEVICFLKEQILNPLKEPVTTSAGFDTRSGNILSFLLPLFQEGHFCYWRKYVHKVPVNGLGGLSLSRKSVVRLTDRPNMTLEVYRGCKTTTTTRLQQTTFINIFSLCFRENKT